MVDVSSSTSTSSPSIMQLNRLRSVSGFLACTAAPAVLDWMKTELYASQPATVDATESSIDNPNVSCAAVPVDLK